MDSVDQSNEIELKKDIITIIKFVLSSTYEIDLNGKYYAIGISFSEFIRDNFDHKIHKKWIEIMDYLAENDVLITKYGFHFIDLFSTKKHIRKLKLEIIKI